jgi:hypothetical protein
MFCQDRNLLTPLLIRLQEIMHHNDQWPVFFTGNQTLKTKTVNANCFLLQNIVLFL